MSRELFGTDGIRGIAGEYPLNDEGAQRVGMAVGMLFAEPGRSIVIGCDTRESSRVLVDALSAGLISVGVSVSLVGELATPALAYITAQDSKFVAGIMVTASHNPYQFNGIKVFNAAGDKLDDAEEAKLNQLIESDIPERSSKAAEIINEPELLNIYKALFVDSPLGGLKLALDTANGSASSYGAEILQTLGAEVTPLFNQPDGRNVNDHCGATDTTELQRLTREQQLDAGIALDGDADRVIMVDELGREVKGDYLMYILAVSSGVKGVVATVMSNLGFELALKGKGIELVRTDVGDRYVLEGLEKTGYRLGGEQSGHILLLDRLQTGDGLLAAVEVLKAVQDSGKSLARWCDEVELLPQALVNIPLHDKQLLQSDRVKGFISQQLEAFHGQGRVLIRPSGTEPLARVMVEAPNAQADAERIASQLRELLNKEPNDD